MAKQRDGVSEELPLAPQPNVRGGMVQYPDSRIVYAGNEYRLERKNGKVLGRFDTFELACALAVLVGGNSDFPPSGPDKDNPKAKRK